MSAYKLDDVKMIVTIDDAKATPIDREDVSNYMKAGYKVRHKSTKRAEQARKRANDGLTDVVICSYLTKEEQEEYKLEKDSKGFFAAKSWFKKKIENEIMDSLKTDEEKKAYKNTKRNEGFLSAIAPYKMPIPAEEPKAKEPKAEKK